MKYALHRIAHTIGLLAAISICSFFLLSLAPGKPFDEMRLNPQTSSATIAAERARYGLDRPIVERYFSWAKGLFHGDVGYSFSYGANINSFLWARTRNTLLLTFTATVLAWLLAIPIASWCAVSKGAADRGVGLLTSLVVSLPEPFLALCALYLAVRFRYSSIGGITSLDFDDLSTLAKLHDFLRHLFLPALILTLAILPILIRHIRSAVSDVLGAPFIEAAKLGGVPPMRLMFRGVLPAAANPVFPLLGFSIGYLLSVSLVVESIMQWPGLGPLFLESIFSRDLLVVLDVVLLSALFMVGGNLIADLLLYWNDPRIRVRG
jgi:peptide/nickel transport system permease protein